jgi:hypothetical protein
MQAKEEENKKKEEAEKKKKTLTINMPSITQFF